MHRKSEWEAGLQGGSSPVVVHTARGREVGGTRFDSRLVRRAVFTVKTKEKLGLGGGLGMFLRGFGVGGHGFGDVF